MILGPEQLSSDEGLGLCSLQKRRPWGGLVAGGL